MPTPIPGGAKFYFGQGVGVLVYPDDSQSTSLVYTGGLSLAAIKVLNPQMLSWHTNALSYAPIVCHFADVFNSSVAVPIMILTMTAAQCECLKNSLQTFEHDSNHSPKKVEAARKSASSPPVKQPTLPQATCGGLPHQSASGRTEWMPPRQMASPSSATTQVCFCPRHVALHQECLVKLF